MPADVQEWLKNTIPGIVLLGALGSLMAVALGKALLAMRDGFLRAPYRWHKAQQLKQAWNLGGAAANIERDKTGRMLSAYLAFHLCRLTIALTLLLFAAIFVGNVFLSQAQVALTLGLFVSISIAFLALYWSYFEFEYIYRTYLFFWKNWETKSAVRYGEYLRKKQEGDAKSGAEASES